MTTTAVHLTGGLGNQLFQLAAALGQAEKGICKIETVLGRPRTSQSGRAEVFSFRLPSQVIEIKAKSRFSNFLSRVIGYGLRQSVFEVRTKREKVFVFLISLAIRFALFIFMGIIQPVFINCGIGFSENALRQKGRYLIGYFQSYKFVEKSASALRAIDIPNKGTELRELIILSEREKPLVVHYRFGDYLKEKNFGIPGSRYYSEGIQMLWQTADYNKIWVFSDDIEMAKSIFPSQFIKVTRWISEVDNSSASTLEAMRLGKGYVIANSTFSWWGAFLSHNSSAPVVAPTPWFQFGESPRDILPSRWTKISAFD